MAGTLHGSRSEGFLVLFLAILCASSASAQSCGTVPADSECLTEGHIAYTDYLALSGRSTNVTAQFHQLDAIPLCTNCVNNVKKLICTLTFPEVTNTANCLINARIPEQSVCDATFDSCVPADFPAEMRATIIATLQTSIGGSCNELYSVFTISPPTYTYAVEPQAGCSCDFPAGDLGFCTGVVDYQIWDALAYFGPEIVTSVETYYNSTTDQLRSVDGLSCPSCENQVKKAFCAGAFLKCDLPNNKLGIQPCESVCNDILVTCRLNELTDPAILGFINATGFSDSINIAAVSGIGNLCSTTGLFTTALGCNSDPTPEAQCPCVKPTFTPGSICSPYVDYEVFPVLAKLKGDIEATVSLTTSVASAGDFSAIVCQGCKDSITEVACYAGFPRCTATRGIATVCTDSCTSTLDPCGLPSMEQFCKTGPAAVLPQTGCVSVTPKSSGTPCTYCGRRPDLKNCGSLADWDTFVVSLAGLNVATYDNQFGTFFNTINFPSCPECRDQIKRTLCSIFIMPCSTDIIDELVSVYLNQPVGTKPNSNDIINLLPRPCFSKCSEVFANCLLTLNSSQQLFFKCDTTFPAFPFPLFSQNEASCHNHTYPPLPPPQCPILRGVAPTADNSTGVSAGVVAALVVCVGVLPASGAGVVVIMWLKKMWIFKVPKPVFPPDADMDGAIGDGGNSTQMQSRDTWTKSNVPARVTNTGWAK